MAENIEQSLSDVVATQVNGKTFVSGLIWRQLISTRTYLGEAKKIGRELQNMEMVAIRKGRFYQAGFAPKQADARNRRAMRQMYSLAACVAGRLGENGIGVFALPDGRYTFIAVRKGAILPGLDKVGDRAAVLSLLQETYSAMTGSKSSGDVLVIAPKEFGADAVHETLEDILKDGALKPEHQLQPLRFGLTKQEWMTYGCAATALVVLSIGATAGWRRYQQMQQEKIDAENAAQRASDNATALAKAQALLVRGWQHLPNTTAVVTACDDVMHDVDPYLGGWRFSQATCVIEQSGDRQKDLVQVVYVGGKAGTSTTVGQFLSSVRAIGADAQISFDANGVPSGTLRRPLRIRDPAGGWVGLTNPERAKPESELAPSDQRLTAISELIQKLPPGTAELKAEPIVWAPPKDNTEAKPPGWREFKITVSSKLPLTFLLEDMTLDGLTSASIDLAQAKKDEQYTFTLKGKLYGR